MVNNLIKAIPYFLIVCLLLAELGYIAYLHPGFEKDTKSYKELFDEQLKLNNELIIDGIKDRQIIKTQDSVIKILIQKKCN